MREYGFFCWLRLKEPGTELASPYSKEATPTPNLTPPEYHDTHEKALRARPPFTDGSLAGCVFQRQALSVVNKRGSRASGCDVICTKPVCRPHYKQLTVGLPTAHPPREHYRLVLVTVGASTSVSKVIPQLKSRLSTPSLTRVADVTFLQGRTVSPRRHLWTNCPTFQN
ncbi:hypothetical protein J6590_035453 [Homalodisca vitripennis]|nr:hypothetical protein J6590_035453 [Homalodisca vitripennis]